MSNVKNVNNFFNKTYGSLYSFSKSPFALLNPANFPEERDRGYEEIGPLATDLQFLGLKIILSPILVPATAVTASVSLVLAAVTTIAHLFSLAFAATLDGINYLEKSDSNAFPK